MYMYIYCTSVGLLRVMTAMHSRQVARRLTGGLGRGENLEGGERERREERGGREEHDYATTTSCITIISYGMYI